MQFKKKSVTGISTQLLGPADNLIAELTTYDNVPAEFFFDFNKKEILYNQNKQPKEKCQPPLLDELIFSNGVYQVIAIFSLSHFLKVTHIVIRV